MVEYIGSIAVRTGNVYMPICRFVEVAQASRLGEAG